MDTQPKSVVFIAGTFFSNSCWEEWKLYFESEGYICTSPPWPHKQVSSEELRNGPSNTAIASIRLAALTRFYGDIVKGFPVKPILIGHSLGGLIVQLLIQQGLGTAGVAVHSFPPFGILSLDFSFLKKWWHAIGFFSSAENAYLISFVKWKHTVSNGMTCEQQKQSYYDYAIPESKLVVRDALTRMSQIDFEKQHAPLLFTSGGHDRLIPSNVNYRNFEKYKSGNSITDYEDFKASNHLVFGPRECMEEADFIIHWLDRL
ncbi:MAG: alpha/beta hydrolase [Marivirga sp.]|nr:alpha/beta hydrolase [Marivirga sp.]